MGGFQKTSENKYLSEIERGQKRWIYTIYQFGYLSKVFFKMFQWNHKVSHFGRIGPDSLMIIIFIIGFKSKYFEWPFCLNIMSLHWHLISTDRQKVRLQFSEQSSIYFQLNQLVRSQSWHFCYVFIPMAWRPVCLGKISQKKTFFSYLPLLELRQRKRF